MTSFSILAEAKLKWAFKLYDVNNDGVIDLKEMAVIIEMMDNLDGVIPGYFSHDIRNNTMISVGEIRYDANGNPEPLPTAEERAASLFSALDKDNDGSLTKQEFLTGYTKRSNTLLSRKILPFNCFHSLLCRSHILKKQDADDQRRKLNCLIFLGPVLNTRAVETDSCSPWLASIISLRTGVRVGKEDIAFSEIKKINEEKKSAFVRLVCPNNSFYQLTFQVCRH